MSSSLARTQLRQKRIMTYFIEAANAIIFEEGMEAVTIRRVADLAGYTSATLYNYFDDIQHLVFLSSIVHLEAYNKNLPKYTKWCKNSLERYMAITERFCEHAFSEPDVYELLFFKHSDKKLEQYTKQYYELFPDRAIADPGHSLAKFFNINSIKIRNQIQLEQCVAEGFLYEKDIPSLNDLTLMIFKYSLDQVKTGRLSGETAQSQVVSLYSSLFCSYVRRELETERKIIFENIREHSACPQAYCVSSPGLPSQKE